MNNKHHELSPSKFGVWEVCPHFDSADIESPEALRGTEEHSLLEGLLKNEIVTCKDNKLMEKVLWAYETINGLANQIIAIEEKIDIAIGDVNFFGTPDVVCKDDNGYIVFDYKSGVPYKSKDFHRVQLMAYGLGIMQRYNIDIIRGIVLYGGNEYVIEYVFNYDEAKSKIIEVLGKRFNQDEYEPKTNSYCKYCLYYGNCPATIFNENYFNQPEEIVKLPETDIKQFFAFVDMINAKADAVKNLLIENLKSGTEYETIILKEIKRSAIDVDKVKDMIIKSSLTKEDLLEYVKFTQKDITKLTGMKKSELRENGIIKDGNVSYSLTFKKE